MTVRAKNVTSQINLNKHKGQIHVFGVFLEGKTVTKHKCINVQSFLGIFPAFADFPVSAFGAVSHSV